MTTWSSARRTYGEGTPQTGAAVRRQQHSATSCNRQWQTAAPGIEVDRARGQRLRGGQHRARSSAGPTGRAGPAPERPTSTSHVRGRRRWTARPRRGAASGWRTSAASVPPGNAAGEQDADGDRAEGAQPRSRKSFSKSNGELNSIGGTHSPAWSDEYPGTRQPEVRAEGGRRRIRSAPRATKRRMTSAAEEAGQGGRRKDPQRRRPSGRRDASSRSWARSSRIRSCHPSRPPTSTRCSRQQHDMSVKDLKAAEDRLGEQGTRHRRLVAADEQRRRPEVGRQVRRAAEGRLRPVTAERAGRHQVTWSFSATSR